MISPLNFSSPNGIHYSRVSFVEETRRCRIRRFLMRCITVGSTLQRLMTLFNYADVSLYSLYYLNRVLMLCLPA